MRIFFINLFICIFLNCGTAFCQSSAISYTIMNQYENDMVYNLVLSHILISIPSTDVVNGNSVGMVDPNLAVLSSHYFIGSEPNPIALTDNNNFLFVGLDGSGNIKKFDLTSNTSVLNINLGAQSF